MKDAMPDRIPARTQRRVLFFCLVCLILASLLFVGPAKARAPVPPDVFRAVRHYWRSYPERVKAFDVIACETGNRYNTTALNGPWPPVRGRETYAGMFQFGSFARSHYGFGWDAWTQARAAHRYYMVAGWSPWSCA